MTDNTETPLTTVVADIVTEAMETAYERFDQLHAKGIDDTQIIRALRANNDYDIAADYIEWGECIDPDEDGAPHGAHLVTDPIDAPSYDTMVQEALAQHMVDYLRKLSGEAGADGAYIRADALDDVVIDGHINMLALAGVIIGASKATSETKENN